MHKFLETEGRADTENPSKEKTVALTEKSGGDRRHWTLYKSSLLITVNLKTFVNPGLAGKIFKTLYVLRQIQYSITYYFDDI